MFQDDHGEGKVSLRQLWSFGLAYLLQFSSRVMSLCCGEQEAEHFSKSFSAGGPSVIQVPYQMQSHETWNLDWDAWTVGHVFHHWGYSKYSSGAQLYVWGLPIWQKWLLEVEKVWDMKLEWQLSDFAHEVSHSDAVPEQWSRSDRGGLLSLDVILHASWFDRAFWSWQGQWLLWEPGSAVYRPKNRFWNPIL